MGTDDVLDTAAAVIPSRVVNVTTKSAMRPRSPTSLAEGHGRRRSVVDDKGIVDTVLVWRTYRRQRVAGAMGDQVARV